MGTRGGRDTCLSKKSKKYTAWQMMFLWSGHVWKYGESRRLYFLWFFCGFQIVAPTHTAIAFNCLVRINPIVIIDMDKPFKGILEDPPLQFADSICENPMNVILLQRTKITFCHQVLNQTNIWALMTWNEKCRKRSKCFAWLSPDNLSLSFYLHHMTIIISPYDDHNSYYVMVILLLS